MSGTLELLLNAADSFYPHLVHHVWASTIFLGGVLAIALLLNRWLTAKARFGLVSIGILKFAVPAAPASFLLELVRPDTSPAESKSTLPLELLSGVLSAPEAIVTHSALWPAALLSIWVAVAACILVIRALSRRRLLAVTVRTAVPPHPRETEALERARRRLGIARSIDLARSSVTETPAVLRTTRPIVILPCSTSNDLSDDELEAVLCHECAHIARLDNLTGRVGSLICALFWFNPLLWIAQHMALADRERACDEVVAELGPDRWTYLDALKTFCRASIAPRLPGISCMATARLKERIDHFMDYNELRKRAFSPNRVFSAAIAALILFVLLSSITGSLPLFANSAASPYAIQAEGTNAGETTTIRVVVTDNRSQQVIAAPALTVDSAEPTATTSTTNLGRRTVISVRPSPEQPDEILVDVKIYRDGAIVYASQEPLKVHPPAEPSPKNEYSGEPINLTVKNAKLSDVIGLFGKLTGLEMQLSEGIDDALVSVDWRNVPWDRAFEELLANYDLTFRIEGSTVLIEEK